MMQSYAMGLFIGFMIGFSLAMAICFTYGNAFPGGW